MSLLVLPSSPLFFLTLILGTLISISSNSWIFIWIGLELNLLSFIPLLASSSSNQETSAIIKYFLVQAIASGLLLLFSTILLYDQPIFSNLSLISLMLALIVKAGLPPCHFWLPSVISSLNWLLCAILATWQKVAPITILIFLTLPNNFLLISFLILGILVSGLGGLNQTQTRSILAYSSIGHISWIVTTSIFSSSSALIYLILYILLSLPLFIAFSLSNLNSAKNKSRPIIPLNFIIFIPLFLISLGGLPPLTGFVPKWLALETLTPNAFPLSIALILGSTLNLSYYLNLSFALFSLPAPRPHQTSHFLFPFSILATFTCFSLPILL